MRSDFSRQTFDADQHYTAVLMQQGRVQLDADWNEQQAINRHRTGTDSTNLVGPAGAPRTAPGFSLTPQGNDLLIGQGDFYFNGILCQSERDVLLTQQHDLPQLDQSPLPTTDGLYLAYLEVWERHVTPLEAPLIRETALGGPDTATRAQTVWQVRLLPVADPGGTLTCATVFPEWTALLRRNLVDDPNPGRMRAESQPEDQSPDPLCVLPPSAGYRRLENQLYRVEIHRGGDRTQARFKWSRDNGTVASAIVPDANGAVVRGSVIGVAEIGKDGMLTFASEPLPEWLELTDDRFELLNQRGQLARVQSVNPATRTITFAPGTLPALSAAYHPVVRRWDQTDGTATDEGVPMTGDWQALEAGVRVRFDDGLYRTGDFWLVPARTAIGFDSGTVEWPRDSTGALPRLPLGTRHHFARLALLRRQGGMFALVPGGDCRPIFPPLTAITAGDVGFTDTTCDLGATTVQQALDALCGRIGDGCTITVSPGPNWVNDIARIGAKGNAKICFTAGTFDTQTRVTLRGPAPPGDGHLVLEGIGAASKVQATQDEVALEVDGWASVTIRDLAFRTVAAPPGTDGLNGALTIRGCPNVTIDNVTAVCHSAPSLESSCITVEGPNVDRTGAAGLGTSLPTRAVIHNCTLGPGEYQVGLMIRGFSDIAISGVTVAAPATTPWTTLAALPKRLKTQIFGLMAYQGSSNTPGPPKRLGGFRPPVSRLVFVAADAAGTSFFTFRTRKGGGLFAAWDAAIDASPSPVTLSGARTLVRKLAFQDPGLRGFVEEKLKARTPVISQGIVVGGKLLSQVRVENCTVLNAIQGIHIATSQGGPPPNVLTAQRVVVRGNTVEVLVPVESARMRHGIFVGNSDSVLIAENRIKLTVETFNDRRPTDGIRLWGEVGRDAVIRDNHLIGFYVAIVMTLLGDRSDTLNARWRIRGNFLESNVNPEAIVVQGPPSASVAEIVADNPGFPPPP